jgi:hypothetical protein
MLLLNMLTTNAAAKHNTDTAPSPQRTAFAIAHLPLSLLGSTLRLSTDHSAPAPAASSPDHPSPASPLAAMSSTDTPLTSPAPSRPVSSGSSAAGDDKPRKRSRRPRTSYIIAHPPPSAHMRSKNKVHLQLQQKMASQRPKPLYEVIPFSLLADRTTRRFARTFNTSEKLGHNDLLILKAEAYDQHDSDTTSDDERLASREIVGVICPGKPDRGLPTEICMDGSSRWEVTPMPNGGFEFNSLDAHGLSMKARWVAKPPNSRRRSGLASSVPPSPALPTGQDDKKWNFSTISTSSRRHPVIATMTKTCIDVNDSYVMPSATSPSTPSVPPSPLQAALTPSSIGIDSFLDKPDESTPIQTDDFLRRFIVVSGMWVSSLHETSRQSAQLICSSPITATAPRPAAGRTVSMSVVESSRSEAFEASTEEKRRSIPSLIRTGTTRIAHRASFTHAPSSPMSVKAASSSPAIKTRSRRANSTGTTNLRSMSGSMRKRYAATFENQALPETEEERQVKRSVEILRVRELAMIPSEEPIPDTPTVQTTPELEPTSVIPSPVIIPPSPSNPPTSPLLPSPPLPDSDRARKTQSAFNPIKTTGMWDSGVTEGPGIKKRPTSMFVLNERMRKEAKKRGRSSNKDKAQAKTRERSRSNDGDKRASQLVSDYGGPKKKRDWARCKESFKELFGLRKSKA